MCQIWKGGGFSFCLWAKRDICCKVGANVRRVFWCVLLHCSGIPCAFLPPLFLVFFEIFFEKLCETKKKCKLKNKLRTLLYITFFLLLMCIKKIIYNLLYYSACINIYIYTYITYHCILCITLLQLFAYEMKWFIIHYFCHFIYCTYSMIWFITFT